MTDLTKWPESEPEGGIFTTQTKRLMCGRVTTENIVEVGSKVAKKMSPSKNDAELKKKNDQSTVSRLCLSRWFQSMCENAFKLCDEDKSGEVDEKELYQGLLLIHLQLGLYAGPAACRPIGRDRSREVFKMFDVNNDEQLSLFEFKSVMMLLFSNVLLRVLVQWMLTILIVPMISQKIVHDIESGLNATWIFITELDEHTSLANSIEIAVESVRDYLLSFGWINASFSFLWNLIPVSVLNTIPITLCSILLASVVVPWIIFKIDDTFQWIADRLSPDDDKKEN